jgi:oligosaccharide repeat unit polymerase
MIYALITLIILVFTLLLQYRRYGLKVTLHPSAYFLGMWIISVISFILFYIAGLELIIYEPYLIELFIFISFTSICFLFFGRNDYKKIRQLSLDLSLKVPFKIFMFFSYVLIISSLIGITSSGFDVAQNRDAVNQAVAQNIGNRLGIFGLILGIISMLNLPFSIYGGWMIGKTLIMGAKKINYIYYFPLLSSVIDTIAGGGRANIISSGLIFILGFLLGFFSSNDQQYLRQKFKPVIKFALLFILVFSLYATFVSNQRSRFGLDMKNSRYISILLNEFPILQPVSGIIEYFVFHYQGYQWRRDDIRDTKLEYGQNTFAFITHFNIPVFSQILGENLSLQNALNLKYIDPVESTLESERRGRIGHSITPSVYFVLYRDFGFYGTLVMIFLFVGLTQLLFKRLFYKHYNTFWSIILFIAIYRLWTQTFFAHHLSGTWMNGYIYPLILLEILNKLFYINYKKKTTRLKQNKT